MRFSLLLFLAFSVFAKVTTWKEPFSWNKFLTEKEYVTFKKQYKESGGRKVASGAEVAASEAFQKLTNEFLKSKTSDDIEHRLVELKQNYSQYPDDVKLAATLALRMKPFRGFVYRMLPIARQSKIVHTRLLTQLKNMFSGMQIYFPNDHTSAVFKYLTEPYKGMPSQFESISELQDFFVTEVYPNKVDTIRAISKIDFSQNIVWDNKIVYGSESFQDDIQRYQMIGTSEKELVLAKLHRGAHNLLRFCAYEFPTKEFFKMINGISKEYGYDVLKLGEVDGVSEEDKVRIIRKWGEGKMVLKKGGDEMTKESFKHLKESFYRSSLAWEQIQHRSISDFDLINIAGIQSNAREINLNYDVLNNLFNGKAEIVSRIDKNNVVLVDLPAIYNHPVKDLTALLPVKFDQSSKTKELVEVKGKKKKVYKYKNYSTGRAIAWDVSAYNKLFPSMSSGADLPAMKRALGQSYGGWVVTSPLSMFIK